jgi:multidrug efflux system membrane fusion protein
MSEPASTRPALATTTVPAHVGAGAAAPQSQPPAVEKVDAAPAPEPPGESANPPAQPQRAGQWLGRHAVVAVLVLGAIVYAGYELSALLFAYTGDAYVDADVIVLAPRVEGPIDKLTATDNTVVTEGELLFETLPDAYAREVAQLEAGVRLAQTTLTRARDRVSETEAEIEQRQATLTDARATQARYQDLFDRQVIARQELDNANRDEKVAQAMLLAAQDRLVSAKQGVVVQEAELAVAQAALERAAWRLAQTRIYAPASGRVAPFETRVGDYRKPGDPVLAIVTDTNWRVVANVTERHLARLKPGQDVWFTLGSAPWRLQRGTVRSISSGISRERGSTSVLPYVSPTTDWIRLPRRFPVEIDLGDLPKRERLYRGADARVFIWF